MRERRVLLLGDELQVSRTRPKAGRIPLVFTCTKASSPAAGARFRSNTYFNTSEHGREILSPLSFTAHAGAAGGRVHAGFSSSIHTVPTHATDVTMELRQDYKEGVCAPPSVGQSQVGPRERERLSDIFAKRV